MCGALEPVHASKLGTQLHSWYKVMHEVPPLDLQERDGNGKGGHTQVNKPGNTH